MKENKKLLYAFLINLVIVALEIVGVVLSIKRHGMRAFQFYTENSNYFTLVVSSVFCIEYLVKAKQGKVISCITHMLRFISTVCLSITFVVVTTILIPMFPETFIFMMFKDSNLYQHLLCPVLSFVSFVIFENGTLLTKKSLGIALLPTIFYGIVCIVLNLCKVITGPYPFFYLYEVPWYFIVPWLAGVLLIALVIALLVYAIHNKCLFKFKKYKGLQKREV